MAANLLEALAAWVDMEPSFAANFPGGVWYGVAPADYEVVTPYLTFAQGESRTQNVIGHRGKAVVYATIVLEARAPTGAAARELGERARDVMLNGPQLAWDGGLECARMQLEGEGGELEEGLGIDGADVWVHRVPIYFITARG